jgi:hypothetical protein
MVRLSSVKLSTTYVYTVADPEISKRGPAPERRALPEIAKKK